jgi:6-phosphogluconolactonase
MKKILFVLALFACQFCFSQENYLLIGTYTSGKSEGIYVYKFDSKTGDSKQVSSIKSSNPSYLVVSPNQKYVYAVNENADSTKYTVTGHIAAYSFNKATGTLSFINKQESGGQHPCYVAIDKTGKWVFAGNYSSGSVAVLPVKTNGSLDSAIQTIQHEGRSVVEGRQDDAHVHATVLSKDNKTLYVPDLGVDKVMLYNFNNKTGKLTEAGLPYTISEPGAGPRHFDIHPTGKFGYLMEELNGTVNVFEMFKDGSMESIQTVSALPRDYDGPIGSADIHVSPDGKFLYASNRGESNSIGIFKINQQSGMLVWVDAQSTLGKSPRNFNFDPTGNLLLVANQNSDEVVIFKRDKETGLLEDTGKRINVPNPVCIKWISSK